MWYFGLFFLYLIYSQECQTPEQRDSVFVNISSNASFHLKTNRSCCLNIEVYKISNESRKPIIYLLQRFDEHFRVLALDSSYEGRVFGFLTRGPNETFATISITNVTVSDSGVYEFKPYGLGVRCFTLYILGRPTVSLQVKPDAVEEGSSGHVKCIIQSTTVPATHNLTMYTSWFVNRSLAETLPKYRPDDTGLQIFFLTRHDDSNIVECEAKEQHGLTARINATLEISWGPTDDLLINPKKTFYHLQLGEVLPDVRCDIDCKPKCDISWIRSETAGVVSKNKILSLGLMTENTTGEYICTASRQGTFKQRSKSVYILLQESKDDADSVSGGNPEAETSAPTLAIGVVSGLAFVLSTAVLVVLLRRKLCAWKPCTETDKKKPVTVSTIQNRMYEELQGGKNVQENYDAVSLGTMDHSDTNSAIQRKSEVVIYENSKLN